MRKLLILVALVLTAFVASGQQVLSSFNGKFNVTSVSGTAPNFNVSGVFNNEALQYTGVNAAIGDKLYVMQNTKVWKLHITGYSTKTASVLIFTCVDSTGLLPNVPTGQGTILRETPRFDFPYSVSGLRNDLRAGINNHFTTYLDSLLYFQFAAIDSTFDALDSLVLSLPGGIYGGSDTVPPGTVPYIPSGIQFYSDTDTAAFEVYTGTLFNSGLVVSPDSFHTFYSDLGGINKLSVGPNGIVLRTDSPDDVMIRGNDARYHADYSSTFTDLSIPHVGWVQQQISDSLANVNVGSGNDGELAIWRADSLYGDPRLMLVGDTLRSPRAIFVETQGYITPSMMAGVYSLSKESLLDSRSPLNAFWARHEADGDWVSTFSVHEGNIVLQEIDGGSDAEPRIQFYSARGDTSLTPIPPLINDDVFYLRGIKHKGLNTSRDIYAHGAGYIPMRAKVDTVWTATGNLSFRLELGGSDNVSGVFSGNPDIVIDRSGDLRFRTYLNTRNDPGVPANVLTTNNLGDLRSHPISELITAAGAVTGTGTANQFTLWNSATTIIGNPAFTYRILHRTIELNTSSTSFNNNRGRIVIGGADTVFNAAAARHHSLAFSNSIRTSNTGQYLSYLGTGYVGTVTTPVFYVDHNNTSVIPYSFTPPTVTIAGGVTGTLRNETVLVTGQSGQYSSLRVQSGGSTNALVAEGLSGSVASVATSALTTVTGIVFDIQTTPAIDGNMKSAMRFQNSRTSANGNGIGVDFNLRASDNGIRSNYISNFVIDNITGTFTSSFIFEPYTNNIRSEHLRIGNNGIGVNLGAQPSATIHAKGSGTTSATYSVIVTNSGGVTSTAALVVRDDGNSGFGTNVPTYRITASGTVYADGISPSFIATGGANPSGVGYRFDGTGIAFLASSVNTNSQPGFQLRQAANLDAMHVSNSNTGSSAVGIRSVLTPVNATGTPIIAEINGLPAVTNIDMLKIQHYNIGAGTSFATVVGKELSIAFGAKLVNGVNSTNTITSRIGMVITDRDTLTADADLYFRTMTNGAIGEVMRIAGANSSVGIGVTIPTAKFHLLGTARFESYPSSLNSAGSPVNVLTTDASGNLESHTVAEVVSSGGGINGLGLTNRMTYWTSATTTGYASWTKIDTANFILTLGNSGVGATLNFGDTSTTRAYMSVRGTRYLHGFDNLVAQQDQSLSMYFGYGAGRVGFGGIRNTVMGTAAASSITTAQHLTAYGSRAVLDMTTGNGVYIGQETGGGITGGVNNVHIGGNNFNAYVATPNISSTITIGVGARVRANNQMAIGDHNSSNIREMWYGDPIGSGTMTGFGNAQRTYIRQMGMSTACTDCSASGAGLGGNLAYIGLAGANGTGTGFGGDVYLAVSLPGVAGTTQNPLTNAVTVKGTDGDVIINANTSTQLIVGTTTGTGRLFVQGAASTSATWTAQFHNSTGTNNALMVRDDGFVAVNGNAPVLAEKFRVQGGALLTGPTSFNGVYVSPTTGTMSGRANDGKDFAMQNTSGTENGYIHTQLSQNSGQISFDGINLAGMQDGSAITLAATNVLGTLSLRSASRIITLNQGVSGGTTYFGAGVPAGNAQSPQSLEIHAGDGALYLPGALAFHGGILTLRGGNGESGGGVVANNGGDVRIHGGLPHAAGNDGNVYLGHTGSATRGKVGIAIATTPAQTLHVAGTQRLTGSDGTATTIMGRDADGDISAITLGSGITLVGNVLDVPAAAGTDITYTGTSSPVTLNSSTGTDVTIIAGTNMSLSATGSALTLNATGGAADLTFTGASSPVTLNSSTGTDVTFTAGTNMTFVGTGTNITMNATDLNGIYTASGTVAAGTLATLTEDPGGTVMDFGIGIFPIWPDYDSDGTEYGFHYSKNYNAAIGMDYGTSKVRAFSAGVTLETSTNFLVVSTTNGFQFNSNVEYHTGNGSPEGVITADRGSWYSREDGGTGTTFYIKESGTGNTGWVAVSAGGASPTDLAFSGTSSPVTLTSSTGTDATFTAGTGISLTASSSNINIINSAPDQTVSIAGAGISVVTGTYPNFTVTSTEVDGSTSNELQTFGHAGTTTYTNTLSGGGGAFTLQASGIATISHSAGTITIGATEVDGALNNEGNLSVTASGVNSSDINSNSAGSSPVTLDGQGIIEITEVGNVITIEATETDGSTSNELQNLGYTAATGAVTISSGTGFTIPVMTASVRGLTPDGDGSGTDEFLREDGTWAVPPGGALSDADYGDITVSGTGTVMTIDNDVVTYAKMQNVAANSFLANVTGSGADVQEIATNRIPLFASAITGTPSASTFLRGDGFWGVPSVDGNGIYSGSGTVTTTTTVDIAATMALYFNHVNSAAPALGIDETGFISMYSPNSNHILTVQNSGTSITPDLVRQFKFNTTGFEMSDATDTWSAFLIPSNSMSADYTLTLPVDDGTSGQVLSTNGSGVLSWTTPSGGVADGDKGDITVSSSGTVWDIDAGVVGNTELASGTGGFYKGSGTIAGGATGTITASSTMNINYNGGNTAMTLNDATGTAYLGSKDLTQFFNADNTSILMGSGTTYMEYRDGVLRNWDSDITQYVGIQPPATGSLTTSYTLTLPTTDGNAGEKLITDGSGALSWKEKEIHTKGVTIENVTSSENLTVFYTNQAITITELNDVVAGSSPSVTYNIRFATTRTGSSTDVLTANRTLTSTTGSNTTTFNDATIPADSWVWIITSATSGTVNEFHVTVNFTTD